MAGRDSYFRREPTFRDDLDSLITIFKNMGLKVRLDSNGTNPDILEDLIQRELVDCVAMDIKAPLREVKYNAASGALCNLSDIERSIKLIMGSGIEYEFRTTVCPAFLDKSDIVENRAKYCRSDEIYSADIQAN